MYHPFSTWQQFEEYTRDVLDSAGFTVEFRKVFSNGKRKFQHDVVAHDAQRALCIDCKFYGAKRQRTSSLKEQAKIHAGRTKEFEKLIGKRSIAVIATSLDDQLLVSNGCVFVPIEKMNDFLVNISLYEEELKF